MHLGREGVGGISRLRLTFSLSQLLGSVLFTHGLNPLKSVGSENSVPGFTNLETGLEQLNDVPKAAPRVRPSS